MSRVIPADKTKQLVPVVDPLRSKDQSGSTTRTAVPGGGSLPVSSTTGSRVDQISYSRAASQPTSLPPATPDTPEPERDPHNEVERRRKLRITQNIRELAETLSPPCHCGRATRTEILEMVVKQIGDLQQKNSELESQLKELPSPTASGEELSRRAIVLVEENLRLRTLLLAAITCEEKSPDKTQDLHQSRGEVQQDEEKEEGGKAGMVVRQGCVDEDRVTLPPSVREVSEGERESERAVSLASVGSCSEQEETGGLAVKEATGGDRGERREGEKEGNLEGNGKESDSGSGEEKMSSVGGRGESEGSTTGENGEQVEVGGGRELEGVNVRETTTVEGGDRGSATVDQSWPISSLLSDDTRSGPREPQAMGLPILSPTYIAEHCSTSGCDQQFFGPTTSVFPPLPPPPISRVSVTDVSVPQFPTQATAISSSLSTSVSTALAHQQSSRQSIVQPWVGSHCSTSNNSTRQSGTGRRSSMATQPVYSTVASAQTVSEQRTLPAHPRPGPTAPSSDVLSRASSVPRRHSEPSRHSRCTSRASRSRSPRTGRSRGHTHAPHYLNRQINHNPASVEVSPLGGGFPVSGHSPGHTILPCDNRGQPYFSGGVPSLTPSTATPLLGHTTSPLLNQPRQLPTSSVDPFYHCSPAVAPVYPSQQSSLSFLPPPHCHTPPQGGASHPHFPAHHPYQHAYTTLPPLPPPPPPPLFPLPHHQHTPSHHNAVWRPYSDRQQTSMTRFSLSDILSPSPSSLPSVVSPPVIHQQPRIPSFFVDHLLDDL